MCELKAEKTRTMGRSNNNATKEFEVTLEQEMRTALPNLLGITFHTYPENRTITLSTTVDTLAAMPGSHVHQRTFYTGSAVFVEPPYRTHHEVYTAQTAALGTFPGTNLIATMRVPSWFDPVAYASNAADGSSTTDAAGSTMLLDDVVEEEDNNNENGGGGTDKPMKNEVPPSTEGLVLGAIVGCIVGIVAMGVVVLMCCYVRYVRAHKTTTSNPASSTYTSQALAKLKWNKKKNSRRSSDTGGGGGGRVTKSHSKSEEFFLDEYDDIDLEDGGGGGGRRNDGNKHDNNNQNIPASPVVHRKKGRIMNHSNSPHGVPEFDITPPKQRRPSHHRRWKSTTMNNVDFGLGGDLDYYDNTANNNNNNNNTMIHRKHTNTDGSSSSSNSNNNNPAGSTNKKNTSSSSASSSSSLSALKRKNSAHRRANSMGMNLSVAVSGNPNIRRRPSMAELLGMDEVPDGGVNENDDDDVDEEEEEFTF